MEIEKNIFKDDVSYQSHFGTKLFALFFRSVICTRTHTESSEEIIFTFIGCLN